MDVFQRRLRSQLLAKLATNNTQRTDIIQLCISLERPGRVVVECTKWLDIIWTLGLRGTPSPRLTAVIVDQIEGLSELGACILGEKCKARAYRE